MIVCVSGWRGWDDVAFIKALAEELHENMDAEVRIGDCPSGVDFLLKEELNQRGVPFQEYVADWDRYGKMAGPLRNTAMLTGATGEGLADLLIALPKPGSYPGPGSGTWGCIGEAARQGIDVLIPRYRKASNGS